MFSTHNQDFNAVSTPLCPTYTISFVNLITACSFPSNFEKACVICLNSFTFDITHLNYHLISYTLLYTPTNAHAYRCSRSRYHIRYNYQEIVKHFIRNTYNIVKVSLYPLNLTFQTLMHPLHRHRTLLQTSLVTLVVECLHLAVSFSSVVYP